MTAAEHLETIRLLMVLLLAAGAALWFLPVGECKECPHCKADKAKRKDERLRREHLLIGHICHEKCPMYSSRPGR